jgi:hypothetical protein
LIMTREARGWIHCVFQPYYLDCQKDPDAGGGKLGATESLKEGWAKDGV